MKQWVSKFRAPGSQEKGAFRFETFAWFVGLSGCLFLYNNCSQQKFLFQYTESAQRELSSKDNSILIENGAKFTNRQDVQIQIFSSESYEFYLTNDPSCKTGGQWENFAPERSWKLAKANQSVPVFAKFRKPGQAESECMSDSIVHDGIPPVPSYVKTPSAITNSALAPFQFSAQDNLSGFSYFECSSNGTTFTKCENQVSQSVAGDGTKNFQVRAADAAGNISSPLPYSWLFDSTPPTVTINLKPSAVSGSPKAPFGFSGQDNLSSSLKFECSLNGAAFVDCSSGAVEYSGLNETQHTFRVAAKDQAGNRSSEVSYTFKIDLTKPSVMITKAPAPYSNEKSGPFEFTGSDEGKILSRFQCRIDGGAFSSCTSPLRTSPLPDGPHQFGVVTFDEAGNMSDEATYNWTIDTVAPTVSFTRVPGNFSNSNNQSITFEGTDSGSGISQRVCYFDSSVVNCDNQVIAINQITDGPHFATVLVKDKAGNSSATIRTDFTIDTVAPTIQITSGPSARTNLTSADFTFIGKDSSGIQKYLCRVDGGPYQDCASPFKAVSLPHGNHILYVQAIDNAGNISTNPAQYNWFIDIMPPQIVVSKQPAPSHEFGMNQILNFTITDDSAYSYSCSLDNSKFDCKTGVDQSLNLQPGPHALTIQAADEFGQQAVPARISWITTNSFNRVTQNFGISAANRDLDVLFVIDNSGSMIEEQTQLANKISGFIAKIAKTNFRIGLTTTDPRNVHGGDGNLVFVSPSKSIIYASDADSQALLSRAIMQGTSGSADERAIFATYRAIEKSTFAGSVQSQLFRRDAAMSVIVISDENNCSSGCSTQEPRNNGVHLINYVKSTFGSNKRFQFHSIIKVPGDTSCRTASEYGHEYAQLSDITGGKKGNICAPDYTSILASIGDTVAGLTRSLDLTCDPIDLNNDGAVNSNDVQVIRTDSGTNSALGIAFTVTNNRLTFSQDLPEGSQIQAIYTCRK